MELESVHRWSRIRNRGGGGGGRGRWNKNNGGSFESVGWIIRIRSMTLGISYPRVLFNVVACSLPAAGVNSILFRYFKRCTFETSFFFFSPPSPSSMKGWFEKESLKPVNGWVSFKWVLVPAQKWKYNCYEKGEGEVWKYQYQYQFYHCASVKGRFRKMNERRARRMEEYNGRKIAKERFVWVFHRSIYNHNFVFCRI